MMTRLLVPIALAVMLVATSLAAVVAVPATSANAMAASAASGRDSISVSASISNRTFAVGEQSVFTITVQGISDCEAPQPPSVRDLQIRYVGPSTQTYWSNGVVTTSISFRYTVSASKPGTYTIPSIGLRVGGASYKTEPIEIEVTATASSGLSQGSGTQDSLRLVLEPEKTTVYPGEEFRLRATLYIDGVRVTEVTYPKLDTPGLLIGGFDRPTQGRKELDGRLVQTIEFETVASSAVAGALTLGPATMECEISVPSRSVRTPFDEFFGNFSSFDSFFGGSFLGYDTSVVTVASNLPNLTVKPFPVDGKPPSFSGAVGNFVVTASANPTTVKAGDPINLRIEVTGKGNLRSVECPSIRDTTGLKTYEPTLQSSSESKKVFEQVVIVKDPAVTEIPPLELAYFDPETESYAIAASAPIPLTVSPGSNTQASSSQSAATLPITKQSHPTETAGESVGLLYIKRTPGELAVWGDPLNPSVVPLSCAAVASLLLISALGITAYQRDAEGRDRTKQRTKTYQAALATLVRLESVVLTGDTSAIASEARKAMMSCLGQRDGAAGEQWSDAEKALSQLDILCYSPTPPGVDETRKALALCKHAVEGLMMRNGSAPKPTAPPTGALLLLGVALGVTLIAFASGQVMATTIAEDTPLDYFYRGNTHYDRGEYSQAVDLYEQALAQGQASGNLLFNLGNAQAKLGMLPQALVSYMRAAEFIPRDQDLRHNTEVVMSALGLSDTDDRGALGRLTSTLTQSEWVHAAMVAYSLLCVLITWRLVSRRRGRTMPPTVLIVVTGLLFIIAGSGALYRRFLYLSDSRVVVTAQEALVRYEPDAAAAVRYKAAAGQILRMAGEPASDYLVVEDSKGQLGWIDASEVIPVRSGAN